MRERVRRAHGPEPGTGPAACNPLRLCSLAPLFARRWAPDASAGPRPRRRALWVITPDDVAIAICGGDLDKAVPEFGAADVLLGLITADVALEPHVAGLGRAHTFP